MPFGGMLTVGILSAVGSVAGAKIGADASKNAAKQQVASAEAAKADLAPIYQDSLARMQPYNQLGGQALGKLGALSGFPAAAPLPPQTGGTGAPWMPSPPAGRQATPMNGTGEFAVPRGQPLGMLGADTQSGVGTGGGQSSYAPSAAMGPRRGLEGVSMGSQGGMVTLMAPTGETGEFPAEQAEMFIQRGARRV